MLDYQLNNKIIAAYKSIVESENDVPDTGSLPIDTVPSVKDKNEEIIKMKERAAEEKQNSELNDRRKTYITGPSDHMIAKEREREEMERPKIMSKEYADEKKYIGANRGMSDETNKISHGIGQGLAMVPPVVGGMSTGKKIAAGIGTGLGAYATHLIGNAIADHCEDNGHEDIGELARLGSDVTSFSLSPTTAIAANFIDRKTGADKITHAAVNAVLNNDNNSSETNTEDTVSDETEDYDDSLGDFVTY